MWGVLWQVGKWIIAVAKVVAAWSLAHPIAAIGVGIATVVAGQWLKTQPWVGADLLGSLVSGFGVTLIVSGIGGWLLSKLPTIKTVIKETFLPQWFLEGVTELGRRLDPYMPWFW